MRIIRNYLILIIAAVILVAPAYAKTSASGSKSDAVPLESSDLKVGSYVFFGNYPQKRRSTPEPIEWLVLENDGKTALLISRYGLDSKVFHSRWVDITWKDCDLRKWLNSDFLGKSFKNDELERITECELLDIYEAKQYFATSEARKCLPTAYALKHRAWKDSDGYCVFWLGSVGEGYHNGVVVLSDGNISSQGLSVDTRRIAVRPALRIKLNEAQSRAQLVAESKKQAQAESQVAARSNAQENASTHNDNAAQSVLPSKSNAQQTLKEGEILIPAGVYQDTTTYDSVAPYTAYENGKKALEAKNPNGYAMLTSSAKRGCNQARIYLAQIFLPDGHWLRSGTFVCIVPENEDLTLTDRLGKYQQYMRQAADNNSTTAARQLIYLYYYGDYVPKNMDLAFKYAKICALQKDPDGMYWLGFLYSKGMGCQKDRAAAVKWMKNAAHAGRYDAKEWIEDRRGHYVEKEVLASTSRRSYSEMLAAVGDSSSSFDSFAADCYRMYSGGYKDLLRVHASRYTITPTTFYRYFSEYDNGTYNICGIVAREPSDNRIVLTDGNRSMVVYCSNMPAGCLGRAVRMQVYAGARIALSGGRTCLYSPGISDSADAVGRNYRTVKKWKGPKIGGWEDLLK